MVKEEEETDAEASDTTEQEELVTVEGTGENSDTSEEVIHAKVKEERRSPPARISEAGPSGSSTSQIEASRNKPPTAEEWATAIKFCWM